MAVGSVAFIDPTLREEDDGRDDVPPPPDAEDISATLDSGVLFETAEYDPRGGDDTADLPAFFADPAQAVTIIQGAGQLDGSASNDRIFATAGDDAIRAGDGNDELRGGAGDDTLDGQDGTDLLHGEAGADQMDGGSGDDTLFGHDGNDLLSGGSGNDALHGSDGADTLFGDAGNDILQGGLDDDTLDGGAGSDTLFGGWGNDVLYGIERAGQAATDFLNGGGGADTIFAGAGDIVTGGAGADVIALGNWQGAGDPIEITDYSSDEDSLLMLWDDRVDGATEPEIAVMEDTENPGQSLIWMNDSVVASVASSTVTAADIALIPLSIAANLNLLPDPAT